MGNQELDAILQSFVAVGEETKDKLLGAAFCVVNKDGVLYQGSAGRTDLPVDSPPFTMQSFTWIASMTKIVTAAAAMQEVERGGVGLDQDMRPLVPQLAQMEVLRGFEADGKPVLEPNPKGLALRPCILDPLGMQSTTFYSLNADESLQRRKVAVSYRDPETGTLSIGPLPIPAEPPVQCGGGGLWTTCEDFSKFLRAVLADATGNGADAAGMRRRILRPETVAEMLRPQLDDRQREALRSVTSEAYDSMVPEFERTTPLDHGISGIINLADVPAKRRAGSMMWKGFTNGQWWIDPKAGIAAVLIVNVLPQPDPVLTKLHDELERAVYSDLI
ncbi:hypothetical protein MAPG_05947 [Magnaporthiopsis poae ATCC 64411]|uniref:Beta-lactamase-related domain-containing protein n=1 Tax=Magnaporthiopsis poae (strain ATCC 64411 / 73-15) TaxID=644358 RepID=A0A0C4E0R4_MAGP6|nr:hypothetical protein MAPG_05947 [Magnaporthiopsis poae ATCC 64411]